MVVKEMIDDCISLIVLFHVTEKIFNYFWGISYEISHIVLDRNTF